ncbi:type III polyketide synthase [Streptomonospora wellingtoniae]|uniref:3-oxoacyl-[acyl-carrier-protein] synthase III C-terminal domain-containing protein n=1 Tax=Streptomonospora wellingtoniae TaxID=3075544 RepID=A0ABU2KNM0_9ACTN|nr:3-oxoacyl-[acyl-carrier-protein] synthase III C-terminal domain-containing protein [Streptomonospora sp. DSM 45055]MDT0300874.1 3-oxoacyl-[acyl-carrier-protein] synthase III C-terminal domain-containing protein [Streptomonospora sp. DSM 45055]
MMRVAAVRTVLPEHYYSQEEITDAVARWTNADERLVRRFHAATQVTGRPLVWPIEAYRDLDDFGTANDAFIDNALDLGERAIREVLAQARTHARDVDRILVCTSTGVATPTLDARLAQRVGLRADVDRVPLFGLGCSGGAAGLAQLHHHLHGWPDQTAVLVCVELCSLTLQRDDTSTANLVASGLFGDAAAAVVALGDRAAERSGTSWDGPRVAASRSKLYPDTERLMGWDIGEHGFRTILAPDLADQVEAVLADDVASFLGDHGLSPRQVSSWVCHPGGPKVLEKIGDVLGLHHGELDITWRSLRRLGNLSSVSVLHVLEETIADRRPPAGEPGLLMALGPGFSADLVLLRW